MHLSVVPHAICLSCYIHLSVVPHVVCLSCFYCVPELHHLDSGFQFLSNRQLVEKVERVREKVRGDGKTSCLICGVKVNFNEKLRNCYNCDRVSDPV